MAWKPKKNSRKINPQKFGYFPGTEITDLPPHFGQGAGFWVFRPWDQSWGGRGCPKDGKTDPSPPDSLDPSLENGFPDVLGHSEQKKIV